MTRWSNWLGAACLGLALTTASACNKENKRWEAAQESAEKRVEAKQETAEAPKAAEGDTLNKFFPADQTDGLKRTFDQEKTGFVQAKFAKDGTDATLSISDVVQNEEARKKFATAAEKLGDDPLTTVGKNQTTALIANRWQIKVSSQQLDHAARKSLLEKFDLTGLRAFNPATK
ncbi:MAG TPA: hypothetical protein VI072_31380 [Polyangiaceae bacterium]